MRTARIAQLYAASGPFASVFADVSRDSATGDTEVEIRARDAGQELERQGANARIADTVRDRLADSVDSVGVVAPVCRAVVANEDGVLFDDLVHTHAPWITTTWATLPDLGAWLTYEDSVTSFVLAVVNHEGGDVSTHRSAPQPNDMLSPDTTESVGGREHHEHKTRGGGLAHMRYQRTAENQWIHNARDVASVVRSRLADGHPLVILAGEPDARSTVLDHLGPIDGAEVVQLGHGGPARDGGDDALRDAVGNVLAERLLSSRLDVTHQLRDRLGGGEGAAIGVPDVADAFVLGKVETLLIDPAAAAELELRAAKHPGFPVAVDSPVRADLALVGAAARTSADIRISQRGGLQDAAVAALLRWTD